MDTSPPGKLRKKRSTHTLSLGSSNATVLRQRSPGMLQALFPLREHRFHACFEKLTEREIASLKMSNAQLERSVQKAEEEHQPRADE